MSVIVPDLRLKTCIRSYPFTDPLRNGQIRIPGVAFDFIDVKPQIAAFRRMIRGLEFDICELAPTTFVVARAHGIPLVALPVFFVRRFHHEGLMARADSGIRKPKDLEGRRVGVRAYSVTTGVWKRGILQNEYGVDTDSITWVVDDEEHVTTLKLPPNVEMAPPGRSIAEMLADGEIDAGVTGDAGIGRRGKPTENWVEVQDNAADLLAVFDEDGHAERDWFCRTGILPMHGVVALREDVVRAHPELPQRLFDAFVAARDTYVADLASGRAIGPQAETDRALARLVGNPLPYGMEANRPSIEALIDYSFQQRLIPRRLAAEDVFLPLNL